MHTVHDKEMHKRKQGFLQVNMFWFQSYAWHTMMLMTCYFYMSIYVLSTHIQIFLKAEIIFSIFKQNLNHFHLSTWKCSTMEIQQHPFQGMHSASSIWWMILSLLYSKTCISVSLHLNEKPAFSKITTQGTCIGNLSFGARKQHLHVDKRLKLVKKSLLSQITG